MFSSAFIANESSSFCRLAAIPWLYISVHTIIYTELWLIQCIQLASSRKLRGYILNKCFLIFKKQSAACVGNSVKFLNYASRKKTLGGDATEEKQGGSAEWNVILF